MTVIERLKAAGYDPDKALSPKPSEKEGSMECSCIEIYRYRYDKDSFIVAARGGKDLSGATAFAFCVENCVWLRFENGADLGKVETNLSQKDECFRYRLLSRCIQDCLYFVGLGRRMDKFLWGGSVLNHIKAMHILWDSFPEDKKPAWTSYEEIERFEYEMVKAEIF